MGKAARYVCPNIPVQGEGRSQMWGCPQGTPRLLSHCRAAWPQLPLLLP